MYSLIILLASTFNVVIINMNAQWILNIYVTILLLFFDDSPF